MSPSRSHEAPEEGKIVSPFAHSEVAMPTRKSGGTKIILWAALALILIVAGAAGGVLATRYLNDPYRTLESFPVAKYLENHRSVSGARFKGELRVEADLGWKEGIGKLMLFSTPEDSRPIAVLVPAGVTGDIYFNKGQTYMAELEVKEGGLIYANSCRKN